MSMLDWFTSGGKAVEKVTDAVINSGDALFFTDQEKAEYSAKRADMYYKFLELSRDESSIKSITRRVLVFAIMGHYFLFLDIGVVAKIQENVELAKFMFSICGQMNWLVIAIGSFYFGSQLLGNLKK